VADHHASDPSVLAEDDAVPLSFQGETVFAVRTGEAGVMGFDLIVPAGLRDALCSALLQAGAKAAPLETLELLRIEAGRPRWGAELDEEVIPLEAGLLQRAISTGKGCYTGQEVIVRILHRGHVNRHLRGLLLGGASPPLPGTQLLPPGEAKPVGRVTSACVSPRLGQTIALAYVRREIAPGSTLRLDRAEAGDAVVVELPLVASA
jgi:folate-binding protein YgfZ